MDSILESSVVARKIVWNWCFWSSSLEEVIPRYLNASLFCGRFISYVLWISESLTEIVLSLFVGSSTWEPLLSFVQPITIMQHFYIPNFPLEVCSNSSQDWAACCMLSVTVSILLFSQSFAYCVFSSRKAKICLVYIVSLFGAKIVQSLQCFLIFFIIGVL